MWAKNLPDPAGPYPGGIPSRQNEKRAEGSRHEGFRGKRGPGAGIHNGH